MSTNSRCINFLKIGNIFKSKALSILEALNLLYSFLPLSGLLLEKLIETETFSFLFLVQKFYKNCSTVTSSDPLLSFFTITCSCRWILFALWECAFFARLLLQDQKNKTMEACFRFIVQGFQEKQKCLELAPSPLLHYELVWKMFFMKSSTICPILEMIINALLERLVKIFFIFMLRHLMMSLIWIFTWVISIYSIISKSRKGKASKY